LNCEKGEKLEKKMRETKDREILGRREKKKERLIQRERANDKGKGACGESEF